MGMIKRIYGRDGKHSSCYLTRVKLTPKHEGWGQLFFHIFHRGDFDRDPHDHPYDFWTFPLRTYYEDVFDPTTGRITRNTVEAWRWHFRPAEYAHVQIGSARYEWEVDANGKRVRIGNIFGGWTATILWHWPTRRDWGFWVKPQPSALLDRFSPRTWMPWQDYIYALTLAAQTGKISSIDL